MSSPHSRARDDLILDQRFYFFANTWCSHYPQCKSGTGAVCYATSTSCKVELFAPRHRWEVRYKFLEPNKVFTQLQPHMQWSAPLNYNSAECERLWFPLLDQLHRFSVHGERRLGLLGTLLQCIATFNERHHSIQIVNRLLKTVKLWRRGGKKWEHLDIKYYTFFRLGGQMIWHHKSHDNYKDLAWIAGSNWIRWIFVLNMDLIYRN